MSQVAVLGSGVVGQVLADGFLKHGHDVVRGSRDTGKLADWKAKAGARATTATFADAVRGAGIVVLAVKGSAAEAAVRLAGPANLAGKVVIDATNPIADAPPVKGILPYFTSMNESLMERLQKLAPEARFVKAFSSVGNAQMVNPDFGGVRPTMFIAGDDAASKAAVVAILGQFGWDAEDVGGVEGARAIEPLCILWCARGFLHNQWGHAFHLLTR